MRIFFQHILQEKHSIAEIKVRKKYSKYTQKSTGRKNRILGEARKVGMS